MSMNPLSWATGSVVKHITLQNMSPLIDDIGEELKETMKDELRANDKEWTGAAIKSIKYDPTYMLVYSDLIYVYNIEFGRKKGNPPPFNKIKLWVETKLNIQPPESDVVAGKIVNSIATEGIPETRFAKKSILRVIGQRAPLSRKRRKLTKSEKFFKQVTKLTKKFNRKVRKTTRNVNKTNKQLKFIKKYGKRKSGGFKAF